MLSIPKCEVSTASGSAKAVEPAGAVAAETV
jgi:hypothetical protein